VSARLIVPRLTVSRLYVRAPSDRVNSIDLRLLLMLVCDSVHLINAGFTTAWAFGAGQAPIIQISKVHILRSNSWTVLHAWCASAQSCQWIPTPVDTPQLAGAQFARQSYDYLTIMPELRSTDDGCPILKTSLEERKVLFLKYDSLQNRNFSLDSVRKLANDIQKRNLSTS